MDQMIVKANGAELYAKGQGANRIIQTTRAKHKSELTVLGRRIQERFVRVLIIGRLVEQCVDGRCHDFNMPDLLSRDRGDEFVKRAKLFLRTHGGGLMKTVIEGGHFAEFGVEDLDLWPGGFDPENA